ncbi:hypothetical protein GCM10007392_24780 [Saccharospirillum salsuginis]|uniref:Peptidase S24/S26A/S26B/S26C domain-containing protein n=1 Tax=Saccharospirillum salsuginis TaxID=418750 RepID=A0A918K9K3_9GAMM|nr:hypothetical protein GCM10007392_24780 [Saccharospirillum salsuginis]
MAGHSMSPILQPGDWLVVDPNFTEPPNIGDIVIAKTQNMDHFLVKRVAAFPEHYPATEHSVWLLGDNPDASSDSRVYGSFPVSSIQGRVAWVW